MRDSFFDVEFAALTDVGELAAQSRLRGVRAVVRQLPRRCGPIAEANPRRAPADSLRPRDARETAACVTTLRRISIERLTIALRAPETCSPDAMTAIQIIELGGRPVALAIGEDAILAEHLTGEERRIAAGMALYALEIQAGRRPGPYSDADAERFARHAIAAPLGRSAPRARRDAHPRPWARS